MVTTSHITGDPGGPGLLLGQCPSLNAMVQAIASTDIPVLIIGESGTGKEVCARLIHYVSEFRSAPLKKVNCADTEIPRLFSHLKEELRPRDGAKNPSVQTLFLDRVDELDLSSQRTLLSLLSDGESEASRAVTVRLISSTTRSLEHEIETGFFRRELYFRINGAILRLAPLRESREGIPALMEWFLNKYARELAKTLPTLSAEAVEQLRSYPWPGNVRELEHAAKKIVVLGDPSIVLGELHAASSPRIEAGLGRRLSPLKTAARAASRKTERELILQALQRTRWNRKRAASELRISYKSLLYKIKQIGVPEPETRD